MGKFYLGIDLGGTEVKLAVVDNQGKIIDEGTVATDTFSAPETLCRAIAQRAAQLKNFSKLSGTGIGVAGDIDQVNGVVRFSPNLPKWKNANLRKMFAGTLPAPIVVDNDANVAALGALWLDAKGKKQNLICVTLGTGVGGGIVIDGKIYRGVTGTAGEIGHLTLDPNGPLCKCGNRGCIERYVGGPNLSMQAREAVRNGKSPRLLKMVGGKLEDITPRIIAEAALKGDPLSVQLWQEAGERLGVILASLVNMLNPEMIILAGGVSRAGKLLLGPIRAAVKERAFKTPASACSITVSKYTHKLGVVGAALLAKE